MICRETFLNHLHEAIERHILLLYFYFYSFIRFIRRHLNLTPSSPSYLVLATGKDPLLPAGDRHSDESGSGGTTPFVTRQAGNTDRGPIPWRYLPSKFNLQSSDRIMMGRYDFNLISQIGSKLLKKFSVSFF